MDVWVALEESGWYSDYSATVVCVASTAERAKALVDQQHRVDHDEYVAQRLRYREEWPVTRAKWQRWHEEMQARWPASHQTPYPKATQTAEEAWPLPRPFEPYAWTETDGSWHSGGDDIRLTVFRTELDTLCQQELSCRIGVAE